MGKNRLGVVLAADGEKDFIRTFTNVNKSLAVTRSESAKVSAEFEGQKNTIAALTAKHEVLNRRLAEQKEKQEAAARGLDHANSNYDSAKKRLKELEEALEDARKKQESMGISSDELKAQMDDQAKEITALSRKLKDAKAVYDEMKASGSASADEMKAQKNSIKSLSDELGKMKDRQKELKGMASPVDEYTTAVERQKSEIARCENKIKDWQKKVNTAETELINANRALNENAAYMKEAEEAADGCATSIDKFGKSVAQSAVSLSVKDGFLAGIGSNLADAGLDLLKDGLEAVKDTMYDTSAASAKLAASTGLSETAARKYQSVMQQIKGDNFGESYEDVSAAMAEVIQIMGELNETDMRDVTESAITLRDTFDMDVNESIRAVDVMMKTMHVDAATAFDLITKGAQNGLNRSGELVDNITEYGQLWGQAGFSAEQMFAILENGLDAGAYNLDKVNDYVKEFGNSLADGRIEENLSSFSEKTQGLFEEWKNGNASTSDVFYSVIDDLSKMTNQQEALTLASEVSMHNSRNNWTNVVMQYGDDGVLHIGGDNYCETVQVSKNFLTTALFADFADITREIYCDGIIKCKEEITSSLGSYPSQFRAVHGNYGFMIRNDGENTYFLLTNSGDPYGSWRETFPFIINNGNGLITNQTGIYFLADVGIQSPTGPILRTFNATNYSNLTAIGNTSSQASIYTSNRVWKNGSTSTYFSTTSSSDERLKEPVGDMVSYESFFEALHPVPFKYHEGLYDAPNRKPKIQWGFYAQEVVRAFERNGINWHDQELVVVEDGDLTAEELKYVQPGTLLKMNYQNLTALNTHMIQKHSRDISRIEARQESEQYLLNTLQNKVAELQAELNMLRQSIEAA